MFGLNKLALWAIGILLALLVAMGGVLWWVNSDRDELIEQKGQLTLALEVQKQATTAALSAVDAWKASAAQFQKTLDAMAANQAEATKETRRLNDVLSSHDLGKLAQEKPGLVGNRVNSGTDRMLRMLQDASAGRNTDGPGEAGGKAGSATAR